MINLIWWEALQRFPLFFNISFLCHKFIPPFILLVSFLQIFSKKNVVCFCLIEIFFYLKKK